MLSWQIQYSDGPSITCGMIEASSTTSFSASAPSGLHTCDGLKHGCFSQFPRSYANLNAVLKCPLMHSSRLVGDACDGGRSTISGATMVRSEQVRWSLWDPVFRQA